MEAETIMLAFGSTDRRGISLLVHRTPIAGCASSAKYKQACASVSFFSFSLLSLTIE